MRRHSYFLRLLLPIDSGEGYTEEETSSEKKRKRLGSDPHAHLLSLRSSCELFRNGGATPPRPRAAAVPEEASTGTAGRQ